MNKQSTIMIGSKELQFQIPRIKERYVRKGWECKVWDCGVQGTQDRWEGKYNYDTIPILRHWSIFSDIDFSIKIKEEIEKIMPNYKEIKEQSIQDKVIDWERAAKEWKKIGISAELAIPVVLRLDIDRYNLKHIDYILFIKKNVIYFQILWMDERFRGKGRYNKNILSSLIISPLIGFDICLRGGFKERDYRISRYQIRVDNPNSWTVEKINEALKDWDENWEGWK